MKDLVHLDGILSYNTQQAKKIIFFVEGLAIFGPLGVLRRTCLAQSFQGHIWMLYVVISMFKSLFGAGTILESSTRVLEVLGACKVSKRKKKEERKKLPLIPQKIFFKFGSSKTLLSALVMRYISEKSTSNKCEKAGVFSAYKFLFPRSC